MKAGSGFTSGNEFMKNVRRHTGKERWKAEILCLAAAVLILSFIGGCGGKSALKKEFITFRFMPAKTVNDTRPVYLLVRKVNKKEFLTENYNSVADTVFSDPQDASVLGRLMLLPGQEEKIRVEKPDRDEVAVYVFFSQPGEQWKLLLEKPMKSEYRIHVTNNQIVEYKKGLFW